MRVASLEYQPRQPERDVLRGVVRDHFETLRARAADRSDGPGLPQFVEREFRAFFTCGSLAGGFARFRCSACRLERLVAFSCKGRGFCPSCGGRRMTERAAQLVDRVFPAAPVRQWVLTLPPRLRYRLAFDHALCLAMTAAFLGVVFTSLPAARVIRVMEHLAEVRGLPATIRFDNGPELRSQAFTEWCAAHRVALRFIPPGTPSQNAFVERFNRTYRHEILDAYVFDNLEQVRPISEGWLQLYNEERPHRALGRLPPARFAERQRALENSRYHVST